MIKKVKKGLNMDWSNFNNELKNVIETGKIIYGIKEVKKECFIGEPKLLVISKTIPKNYEEQFMYYGKLLGIEVIKYPEKSLELGSVCAKPYGISVIAILDTGQSSIMETLKEKDVVKKKENKKAIVKKEKKKIKEEKKKEKEIKIKKQKIEKEKEENMALEDESFFKDIIKIKKK